MRYELTEYEWTAIKPMLPNKPRAAPRVNDRRVLKGILWVLRSGAPWRDLPESYRPRYGLGAKLGLRLLRATRGWSWRRAFWSRALLRAAPGADPFFDLLVCNPLAAIK
jgi:transposase